MSAHERTLSVKQNLLGILRGQEDCDLFLEAFRLIYVLNETPFHVPIAPTTAGACAFVANYKAQRAAGVPHDAAYQFALNNMPPPQAPFDFNAAEDNDNDHVGDDGHADDYYGQHYQGWQC